MAEDGVLKLNPAGEKRAGQSHLVVYLVLASTVVLLALIFLLPRSLGLGGFVTADEPTWGKRSANFFYALKARNFSDTYQTGHPGVITMWAGAIAYQLKFPEYQHVGQASLGDTKLLQLFIQHGPTPMTVMAYARLVLALMVTLASIVAFLFLRRLFGAGLAVFMFLLIAFEPFYIAHSRVLHTNGLLSAFMFLSLVAYLYYLRTRRAAGLVVSGISAGLSFICISPGIVLVPAIGLLTLSSLWDGEARRFDINLQSLARRVVVPLLAWGALSLLVIYLVWPAMWGDPIGTLVKMLRYGMSAAEGEIGSAHYVGAYEDTDLGSRYLNFYPLTYLWRSTPVTLIGLGLAFVFLIFKRSSIRPEIRGSLYGLILFIVVYGVVMTLGTKKYDRYFLPAYLPLDLIAAVGWAAAAGWAASHPVAAARFTRLKKPYLIYGTGAVILILQLFFAVQSAPYYFTYFNPLMGGLRKAPQAMTVGWGEGLSEAALYLSKQPEACDQRILSWYPLAYSWYSISFGCESEMVEFTPEMTLQDYQGFDYIIIYINQIQRDQPPELLAYLNSMKPVHSVWIDGVEFVRIYRLQNRTQNQGVFALEEFNHPSGSRE